MRIKIFYEPTVSHEKVILHAWEPTGGRWDLEGVLDNANGMFAFELEIGSTVQSSQVLFKYRFLNGAVQWEREDFVRRIPSGTPQTVWTFDYTAQCFVEDPFTGPPASTVEFHVLTNKYAGGQMYVWMPGNSSFYVQESSRDENSAVSVFRVDVPQAMRTRFYYKLLKRDGNWESDMSNRIWLPASGSSPWFKSEQIDVQPIPIKRRDCVVNVIYPTSIGDPPLLHIEDDVADYARDLSAIPNSVTSFDPLFSIASYAFGVYPVAQYLLRPFGEGPVAPRVFHARTEGEPSHRTILFGAGDWYDNPAERKTPVTFIIHPNPSSAWTDNLVLDVSVDDAPPHETVHAIRRSDGTWTAESLAFPNIEMKLVSSATNNFRESRPDGWFQPKRSFRVTTTPVTLHTIDGVAGLSEKTPSNFKDVPEDTRRRLLGKAFDPALVAAGIFSNGEMPYGVTYMDDDAWFVVKAPHSVHIELLMLPTPGKRELFPMSITPDLRYAWCKLSRSQFPPGSLYRIRHNNVFETLDPASRAVADPGDKRTEHRDALWPSADESDPDTSPWSVSVDTAKLSNIFKGSAFRTPGWDWFAIYEMHPLRFSDRYQLPAFDRMVNELTDNGHLKELPLTALELLPTHEFPGSLGWGYNPALYFAIDSGYGGPIEFARAVRASHDVGKAVMLDLVYNHMTQSPLQDERFARDEYTLGAAFGGNLPRYDHPAVKEFFAQATLYLWNTFHLDGFRFDCTKLIVNAANSNNDCLAKDSEGRRMTGAGGGWEFLCMLHDTLHRAANTMGRPWPYLVAEDSDMNPGFGAENGALDGEWHFRYLDALTSSASEKDDKSYDLMNGMNDPEIGGKHFFASVRAAETHDKSSEQQSGRIATQPVDGCSGYRMVKSTAAVTLLGRGIPMALNGFEWGETTRFFYDNKYASSAGYYLSPDRCRDPNNDQSRIYSWFRDIMGLRRDRSKNLCGDDWTQYSSRNNRTVAFIRNGGALVVIATFGTPNARQRLGDLGVWPGNAYKEILNSSWPCYQVEHENNATNGSYDAVLGDGSWINLPPVGAVILERRY